MSSESGKFILKHESCLLGRNGRPVPGLFTINSANMSGSDIKRALKEVDLTEWMPAVEHVNLSLNKKGRWKTIDKLTQQLQDGLYSDSDYAVHVIERVWLSNQANCEGLASNKSGVARHDSRSCLFDSESLLNGCKKNDGKRKKGKKSAENEHDVTHATGDAEIRIEVVQPQELTVAKLPVTTRRRRLREALKSHPELRTKLHPVLDRLPNSETLENEDWDSFDDWSESNDDTPKQEKPKRKLKKGKTSLPSLSWDSDCDLDFEEDAEDISDDEIIYQDDIKMEDFIVPASKNKTNALRASKKKTNSLRRAEPRRVAKITKGKLEYIDKPSDSNTHLREEGEISEQDLDPGLSRDKNSENPGANITLDKESISTEVLKDTFGTRYLECECRPRRFLLNLTGEIRNVPSWIKTPRAHVSKYERTRVRGWSTRRFKKKYRTHFQRERKLVATSGFLVFEELPDGKYRVRCETDETFDLANWYEKMKALFDWTPQSLVESLCAVLAEKSETKKVEQLVEQPTKFPLLQKFLNWPEADNYSPSPFPSTDNVKDNLASHEVEKSVSLSGICGICCEDIDVTPDGSRSLTLTQCGHCFCLTCWKSHVTTAARSGAMQIKCPEFDCTALVDQGTVASLLDIGQLRMLTSRLEDIDVRTFGAKVWCPRPGCGRIVLAVAGSFSDGCVRCDCGTIFCVKCGGNPHWPASCTDLERYESDLKRFGDDSMFSWSSRKSASVQGKVCPKCKSFIEKRGGCPNMVCMCGYSFCWQCLQPWDNHSYNRDCYRKEDTFGAEFLQEAYFNKINRQPKSRTSTYIVALKARMKLQTMEKKHLYKNIYKLKQGLQNQLTKYTRIQEKGGLAGNGWSRAGTHVLKVIEATHEEEGCFVLNWVLDVIFDVNHVIEYGAILVDHHSGDKQLGHAALLINALIFLVQRMENVVNSGSVSKVFQVTLKLNELATLALKKLTELRAITSRLPQVSE